MSEDGKSGGSQGRMLPVKLSTDVQIEVHMVCHGPEQKKYYKIKMEIMGKNSDR